MEKTMAKKKKDDDLQKILNDDLQKILNDVLSQAEAGESYVSKKKPIIAENNRIFDNDCWHGLPVTNKAEKPSIPIVQRIQRFKIASVMVEILTGTFKVKGIKENSDKKDLYKAGSELYTKLAIETDERLDVVVTDEKLLKRANIAGKGLTHFRWDNTIEGGNDVLTQGDFVEEKVHSMNWHPADINNPKIQGQEYHIIDIEKSLKWWQDLAKEEGRTEEEIKMIQPSKDSTKNTFSTSDELEGSENLWGHIKYWIKDKKVWCVIVVPGLVVKPPWNTDLNLYPIAHMDWNEAEEDAYGLSEITSMKYNQFAINKLLYNALKAITKGAFPIMLYDKNRMGKPSGRPGTAFGVNGSTDGAFDFKAPSQLSFDIWRMLDNLILWTKEHAGATETALGEVKPENTSALLANKEQAAVPIASILRRFKQYKKDRYAIYCDFYQTHYDLERMINFEKDGEEVSQAFTGTDYKDVKFSIGLDVGPTSQKSEAIVYNMMLDMLRNNEIDVIEFLERAGQNIPDAQGLIDSREKKQQARQDEINKLTPENQAIFNQKTPEEQEQMLQQVMTQGGV